MTSYEYTGVTIAYPTPYATIGRQAIYRDGAGIFFGGAMAARQDIEAVRLRETTRDAYGHLGTGVVIHVCIAGRWEAGCVLLDTVQGLDTLKTTLADWWCEGVTPTAQ